MDIYPPIHDPLDLEPLDRILDMLKNFRKPMPEPINPVRDIRPESLSPMSFAPGIDMRPINDMIMFQKKGVY